MNLNKIKRKGIEQVQKQCRGNELMVNVMGHGRTGYQYLDQQKKKLIKAT